MFQKRGRGEGAERSRRKGQLKENTKTAVPAPSFLLIKAPNAVDHGIVSALDLVVILVSVKDDAAPYAIDNPSDADLLQSLVSLGQERGSGTRVSGTPVENDMEEHPFKTMLPAISQIWRG